MEITFIKHAKKEVIEIAKELPEWFTKQAIIDIRKDIKNKESLVALENNRFIGFIIYFSKDKVCYIKWFAVKKDKQRKGIGKKLIKQLEKECLKNNIKTIEVDTLSHTVNYKPYEKTRNFYYSVGFKDFKIIKDSYPDGGDKLLLHKKID